MKTLLRTSAACILLILFGFVMPTEKYFDIAKNLDIFATLFKEVNLHYVDDVPPEKLVREGIDAMLGSLDPYTNYIAEEELESFRTMTTGQYAGIGAMIGRVGNKLVFTHPYEGFPAHKVGLKVGDEIIEVDEIDVRKKSPQQISTMLKGNTNTNVKVKIKRFGNNTPVTYTIKREKIAVKNISFFDMITEDVALIKLDDFTPGAGKEVAEAVIKLKAKGAKSIILDLRDNPGGILQEAVNVANVFIPKGKAVVSTKGKQLDWNKTYYTLNNTVDTHIPLAILIGPTSASASEIVAGALQDYDRAVLLGNRTFGKGLVQTTRPLTYNAQLKVTTAKYYIPSGRCIQALDYQHKDDNGNASKKNDSLRIAFKTKNGRTVFDGSGIDPDIFIDKDELSTVTLSLLSQGLIFDYATAYYYKNPTAFQSGKIDFTDKDYFEFKTWLVEKGFEYTSATEVSIDELLEEAKNERNQKDIVHHVKQLKQMIEKSKEDDLDRYKTQIQLFLKQEIAFRYQYAKGQVKESISSDNDMQKAIQVLNSSSELKSILIHN
jgi:carboxyl-terminal processing protease